jgi:hypothetical protein
MNKKDTFRRVHWQSGAGSLTAAIWAGSLFALLQSIGATATIFNFLAIGAAGGAVVGGPRKGIEGAAGDAGETMGAAAQNLGKKAKDAGKETGWKADEAGKNGQ